jgi:hypothetical protein
MFIQKLLEGLLPLFFGLFPLSDASGRGDIPPTPQNLTAI